jgi:hypothetical protein
MLYANVSNPLQRQLLGWHRREYWLWPQSANRLTAEPEQFTPVVCLETVGGHFENLP